MPAAWLGSWYQRGMNSLLEITIDHIKTKGLCIDALPSQQYYFLTDRLNRCTRCLVFIQRHINLLQYRESECIDADDLSSITSCPNMIAPDAVLYTLHRNDSKPQSCPIQPPFHFTNLIKDSSVCNQSISSSYINECAKDYQFHLHLSPCALNQPTFDLQFVCVGTWVEDFHTYFVTRIISKRPRHHRSNQYACFRFLSKERSSSLLSLSIATDDSCRDLYSKQMSTVMTLSASNYQIVNKSTDFCIFPDQYQAYEWYTINGTIRMVINNTDIELIGLNKRLYCHEMIDSEKSITTYQIRTYTNCHITHECLRLIQRTDNVIELYTATLLNENDCYYLNDDNYELYLTVFTKSFIPSDPCPPYINDLLIQSTTIDFDLKTKSLHMSIDCDKEQKLTISQNDQNLKPRSITGLGTCLASWRLDDSLTTHFIAQSKHSNDFYCFSFEMTNRITIRNNRHGCSFTSHEDEESFSIHSVYIEQFCSQSKKLVSKIILLLITIIFSISNIE
ncbi:unnamed protein product [Rotaria magnacalcarata]|uniref:Uncharacterized protein n=1 Tax=Rotaria magnacalcarata TaxID=392030 RepID=A0A816URE1_9BILA|nr:unnamed protein product [Rotaria magnacalcarata]CAF3893035.1 unnamed protein product [Rotaria magnacalcarata]